MKIKKTAKVTASKEVPKILIGISTTGMDHKGLTSFIEFWTDLMTFKKKGVRFHIAYKFSYRRQSVAVAQEELAEFAVKSGCTHLLLMDDDIYDVKAADLIKLLEADKDVVGGIMHTNGFPYAVCAFRRYDRTKKVVDMPVLEGPARLYEIPHDQRKGVQPADLIPFAFTLIKTSVFKDIKQPWFTMDRKAPTDSWFADSMLKAKKGYFAHFDVWLNHRGVTRANQPYYLQLGMFENQLKNSGGIIMLTPEEMKRHEFMMTQKLKEAERLLKDGEIKKQKWYDKDDRKPIAMPIIGPR